MEMSNADIGPYHPESAPYSRRYRMPSRGPTPTESSRPMSTSSNNLTTILSNIRNEGHGMIPSTVSDPPGYRSPSFGSAPASVHRIPAYSEAPLPPVPDYRRSSPNGRSRMTPTPSASWDSSTPGPAGSETAVRNGIHAPPSVPRPPYSVQDRTVRRNYVNPSERPRSGAYPSAEQMTVVQPPVVEAPVRARRQSSNSVDVRHQPYAPSIPDGQDCLCFCIRCRTNCECALGDQIDQLSTRWDVGCRAIDESVANCCGAIGDCCAGSCLLIFSVIGFVGGFLNLTALVRHAYPDCAETYDVEPACPLD